MKKKQESVSSDRFAIILWIAQRLTAFLVLFVLGIHIFNVHYADIGQKILFSGVAGRLKNTAMFTIDISLLFLVLFHGLNGTRSVLIDFSFFNKYEKIISLFLLIIGIIFAVWGIRGLWAFILIRS